MATKKQLAELLRNIKAGKVSIQDAITKAETSARTGKYAWQEIGKANDKVMVQAGFVYQVRDGVLFRIAEKQTRPDGKVATFQLYFNANKGKKETAKV